MKTFILDKTLLEGVVAETPKRLAYCIRKLGTNATADAYLEIDAKPTGKIRDIVAPLHTRTANLLGPLALDDLFYVVSPETKFRIVGPTGSKMRLQGEVIRLEVAEVLPDPYRTRAQVQLNHHFRIEEGTFAFGTDEAWAADREVEIYSITPLTTEKITFKKILMLGVANLTFDEGDIGVSLYYDNVPLEFDVAENIQKGIDALSMPRPPAEGTNMLPFTLKDFPVVVEGDHTLSIRATNTSGADLTPPTGTAITLTLTGIAEYLKLPGS